MATFPHPCGDEYAKAKDGGADPTTIVPGDHVIILGGTKPVPDAGETFSCVAGPTIEAAAAAVPYNQFRVTTAEAIRARGGVVEWLPEKSRRGTMNRQHVHITEVGPTTFGPLTSNPVPKADRIDAGK